MLTLHLPAPSPGGRGSINTASIWICTPRPLLVPILHSPPPPPPPTKTLTTVAYSLSPLMLNFVRCYSSVQIFVFLIHLLSLAPLWFNTPTPLQTKQTALQPWFQTLLLTHWMNSELFHEMTSLADRTLKPQELLLNHLAYVSHDQLRTI